MTRASTTSHTLSSFCPHFQCHYLRNSPGPHHLAFQLSAWSLKANPQLCHLDDLPGPFACSDYLPMSQHPQHRVQSPLAHQAFPARPLFFCQSCQPQLLPLCPARSVPQTLPDPLGFPGLHAFAETVYLLRMASFNLTPWQNANFSSLKSKASSFEKSALIRCRPRPHSSYLYFQIMAITRQYHHCRLSFSLQPREGVLLYLPH